MLLFADLNVCGGREGELQGKEQSTENSEGEKQRNSNGEQRTKLSLISSISITQGRVLLFLSPPLLPSFLLSFFPSFLPHFPSSSCIHTPIAVYLPSLLSFIPITLLSPPPFASRNSSPPNTFPSSTACEKTIFRTSELVRH